MISSIGNSNQRADWLPRRDRERRHEAQQRVPGGEYPQQAAGAEKGLHTKKGQFASTANRVTLLCLDAQM